MGSELTEETLNTLVLLLLPFSILAQTKSAALKYRRSSLHMMMIDDAGLINAKIIKGAFILSDLPDKYNDHSLSARTFVSDKYALTPEEKIAFGVKADSKAKSKLKGTSSDLTGGLNDTTDAKYLPVIIDKYLVANNVAKDMVAKWFGRNAKGGFNMNLIQERGSYDASALQVNIAKSSARGMASIADAGEELIANTFVVVTRFNYVSKKEVYDAAMAAQKKTQNVAKVKVSKLVKVPNVDVSIPAEAQALKDAAYKKATEGYMVQCTSYLYQLVWNDSVAAIFYNDLWMDDSSIDPKKKEAFDKTNLFSLKYIGDGKAFANVPLSLKKKRSNDELISIATMEASDAVIAKLQRDYEVFKTKTPLYTGNPITAKIGLKEGLEPGDKYEVLEQTLDPKTGKTKYVKKGKIKVSKNLIWDNRHNAGEEEEEPIEAVSSATKDGKPIEPKPKLDRTTFEGGSKYYEGMLIRQIK